MAEPVIKPCLGDLPLELLRKITLDPVALSCRTNRVIDLTGTSIGSWCGGAQWFALTRPAAAYYEAQALDMWQMLHALSKTSKALREIALPLLWTNVHVMTVAELGKLRELLRVAPYLASYIKRFIFAWSMNRTWQDWELYPCTEGSLLMMAFSDRRRMWENLALRMHSRITTSRHRNSTGYVRFFKTYNLEYFYEPVDADGPDCKGEDRFIKSSDQLESCITEIVSQLTALKTFEWRCPVSPMPIETCEALAELTTLTSLHLSFAEHRECLYAVPFWNLVRNVQVLSLEYTGQERLWREEIPEQSISQFSPPDLVFWPLSVARTCDANSDIIVRTVIAAAQSGQLKRIKCPVYMQRPFAIRALLPGWVNLEHAKDERFVGWLGAARTLRPLLSHASLWLNSPTESIPNEDRTLNTAEIQALYAYFDLHGVPRVGGEDRGSPRRQSVERYLPWLEEDQHLAQRVAEAWNAVVQRGGADTIRCPCTKCRDTW